MYTTSLLLTFLPLFATTSPISTLESRNPTAPNAGFDLYMTEDFCTAKSPTVAAPVSSTSKFCFNLDSNAKRGAFVWPKGDDSYQAIFFIGPDCPADKQAKHGYGTTTLWAPKTDNGNGISYECLGPLWKNPGNKGSVWMSPPGEKAPGGWPPAPP